MKILTPMQIKNHSVSAFYCGYYFCIREMENCTPEPRDKNPNMWREISKSREIDYGKIQERFKA